MDGAASSRLRASSGRKSSKKKKGQPESSFPAKPPVPFQKRTAHSLASNPNDGSLTAFFAAELSGIFTAMGMTSAQMKSILTQIDYTVTPAQHSRLNNDVLLDKSALFLLTATAQHILQKVKEQKQIKAAVWIQRSARGFLVRNRMSGFDRADRVRIQKRNATFLELLANEREFITQMENLQENYAKALKASPIKGVNPSLLAYLFMNVGPLLVLHSELVRTFEPLISHRLFPFFPGTGECFLKNSGQMLSVYTRYCDIYAIAMHVLSDLCSHHPKFVAFLDERTAEGKGGQEALKRLLDAPLAHFNTYDTKLTEMLASSAEKDPGYMALVRANNLIGAAADLNRGRLETAKRRPFATVLAIEKRIEVEDPLVLLSWTNRTFIKEGALKGLSDAATKKPYLFLFNDLCIIAEQLSGSSVKFHSIIDLSTLELDTNTPKPKSTFALVLPDAKHTLSCKASEKAEWLTAFTDVVEVYKKYRVFGVPLETALAHEGRPDGIPTVVEKGLEYLGQMGMDTEGIFRISGDRHKIIQMKKGFDTGHAATVDFREATIHDVSGIVKLYLRELPEPLVPFALYEALIEAYESYERHEDKRRYLDGLREIFQKVPVQNKRLLSALLPFLRTLSKEQEVTKMTIANLSTVLTPNLIRPEVDTMTTAMQSGKVNLLGESLIRYCEYLMDGNEGALEEEEREAAAAKGRRRKKKSGGSSSSGRAKKSSARSPRKSRTKRSRSSASRDALSASLSGEGDAEEEAELPPIPAPTAVPPPVAPRTSVPPPVAPRVVATAEAEATDAEAALVPPAEAAPPPPDHSDSDGDGDDVTDDEAENDDNDDGDANADADAAADDDDDEDTDDDADADTDDDADEDGDDDADDAEASSSGSVSVAAAAEAAAAAWDGSGAAPVPTVRAKPRGGRSRKSKHMAMSGLTLVDMETIVEKELEDEPA